MNSAKFHAAKVPEVTMNMRQDAVAVVLEDPNGNRLSVGMTREIAAKFVSSYQTAFIAIDDKKAMDEGTNPEERRAFESESARIFVPFKALANPKGTPQSHVLVKISPGSSVQQVFGLSLEQADKLAADLQAAANQMRQNLSGAGS